MGHHVTCLIQGLIEGVGVRVVSRGKVCVSPSHLFDPGFDCGGGCLCGE